MNTAIQNHEYLNQTFIDSGSNPPVSKNPDGSILSRLNDNQWIFKIKVLDRYITKTQNSSTIPRWLKTVVYATYFDDDANYSHDKLPTVSGNLASARSLLANIPKPTQDTFFTKASLSSYLHSIHGKYAQTTVANHLLVYWKLSVTANLMGLCEYPKFDIERLANKHCNPEHKEARQTLAMPISIASQIMGNAMTLFYAAQDSLPSILSMIKEYGEIKEHADLLYMQKHPGKKCHNSNTYATIPLNHVTRKHLEGTSIGELMESDFHPRQVSKWLNRILYACYTLTLAFTGMRKHELFRIHSDSFISYQDDGVPYYTITAETSKLEQGEDRVDQWVCSEMCGPILELINALKKATRINQKSAVIVFNNVHKACVKDHNDFPRRYYENLVNGVTLDDDSHAEYCKLNRDASVQLELGSEWPLASHQWRRTFATLAIRFDLATLPAIKRQFKHVSLQMTEWYANYARITQNEEVRIDRDLNRLLTDIQNEMSADVLYDAYNNDAPLAGGKGKSIMDTRSKGKVPKVYSSHASIKALLERGEAKLKYAGLNYCMNGYKCDQDGVVNAAFCSGCGFSIIIPEIAQKWKRLHERCVSHLEFAAECGEVSPVSFAHFVSQIRAAEHVMAQCDIEFIKYQEKS